MRKMDEWEFQAQIHGIDLGKSPSNSSNTQLQSDPRIPLFGDPETYQSLSNEDKEVETKKMMSRHRAWAGQSFMEG